jgi:hypothetical protein
VSFWLFFLKGVADYFRNHELGQNAGALLAVGFFLSTLNICVVAPCLLQPSGMLLFVPLVIPCALYGWHLRLVIGIRRTIPVRNERAP